MKKIIQLLCLSSLAIFALVPGTGLSATMNFTIEGTYSTGLTLPGGAALFNAGDGFTIQGTFDTDLHPIYTKTNGIDFPISDIPHFDFSAITNLTFTNMPLDQINTHYPSGDNCFETDSNKNGSAIMEQDYLTRYGYNFNMISNYTVLDLTLMEGLYGGTDGFLLYNYRHEKRPRGTGYIDIVVHDRIDLNVTRFDVTDPASPVPIPTSLFLLGSGLAGLAGLRKK